VVAQCSVLERIGGSIDGKNGDEGGREEDKGCGRSVTSGKAIGTQIEGGWYGKKDGLDTQSDRR
jgi:hypothetical protein